jgi:type II secretory ATPase GspE/PulE/Tfp pilus assembly ATPase PilB-like protein
MSKPYPEAIAHYPKSTQILIKMFYNRVVIRNKNVLCIVVGQTGSGKSYSALSLLEGLYLYRKGKPPTPEYIVEHTKFKAIEFMTAMQSPTLKKGEAWTWDEAGIDAGNSEHATIKNRIISWYAQTCRNQHQIIFFTVPAISMLDPKVRRLLHYYIEAVEIDYKRKMGILKPLEMQYNTRSDKIYYHRIRNLVGKNKEYNEIEIIGCPMVSKETLDLYETKKQEFTVKLNEEIKDKLEIIENKNNNTKNNKELETIITKAYNEGYRSIVDIADYLGLSRHMLSKRGAGNIIFKLKEQELNNKSKALKTGIIEPISLMTNAGT